MSDLLSQIFILPVRIALVITAIILIMLYLFSIVWVNRDARERDASPVLWTIIAIIPVAGLVAYCLLRPPLTRSDYDEQEMELELLKRQLRQYGNCPHCGSPVEKDYLACPYCRTQLRSRCSHCGEALDMDWKACPYCAAPVSQKGARGNAVANGAKAQQRRERDSFAPNAGTGK